MWIKKPEFIFILIAFIFGVIMMFLTPPFEVPDEQAHVLRACEVADGIFYNKTVPQNVDCDKYIQKDLELIRPEHNHQVTGYSPVLYVFSAIGVKFGKIWGGNVMFYLGRFFNLFVWITMIAAAIRITPVFKYPFLFAALLPMSLYEGMSFSADSFHNAFAFLFFAYVFKLIYGKGDIKNSHIITLLIFTVISAFTKGGIYPVFLFFFLPMKKHKYLFASACLVLSFALVSYWASINYSFIGPDVNVEYNKYILLHNPFDYIKKFVITVFYNSLYYIKGCIGILGWLNIRFQLFVYAITSLLFMSLFIIIPEEKVANLQRVFVLTAFTGFFVLLHTALYITWTPQSAFKITGVQGRYFISILPYLFMVFAQPKAYVSEKFQKYYKIFIILYIIFLLLYACIALVKAYYPNVFYFYMFK